MSPKRKPTLPLDVYVRVSRTGGRDVEAEGGTAAQQEARCRAQLAADGLTAGEVFVDLDESGGKVSRPALDRALDRIKRGESGGLIVRNLRRFGRTTAGVLGDGEEGRPRGVRWMEAQGAAFLSVEEKLDTSTPMGRFALTIFAALGELELDQRREGWSEVHGRLIANGAHFAPRVPFGYVPVLDERGKRAGLGLDPERAPFAREVFVRRAAGATWRELRDYLAEHIEPAPFAQPSGVAEMVRSRVYCGVAFHGERETPNAHPAIVSEAEWQVANAINGARESKTDDGELLSDGVLRCAGCDGAMVADYKTWRRKDDSHGRVEVYRCRSRECSARASISRARVEPYAEARALEAVRRTRRQLDDGAELAPWLEVLRGSDEESSRRFWNALTVSARRKLIGGALGTVYVSREGETIETRVRFTI